MNRYFHIEFTNLHQRKDHWQTAKMQLFETNVGYGYYWKCGGKTKPFRKFESDKELLCQITVEEISEKLSWSDRRIDQVIEIPKCEI